MTRAVLALAWVLSLVALPALVAAQEPPPEIEVVIEPATAEVEVGVEVDLTIRVINNGATDSASLALHIDITSPTRSGSVDPEDWTSRLTRRVGVIAAGQTTSLDWTIKPISGGDFTVYAVALPESGDPEVWPSNGVRLDVQERRTLNPEGVLPVAIGAPIVVGALLLTRIRRSSRSS
jgi:uncharacterized protein (DUF58 family)